MLSRDPRPIVTQRRSEAWPVELTGAAQSERFPRELAGYRQFRVRGDTRVSLSMLPLGTVHIVFQLGTTWDHRWFAASDSMQRPEAFVAGPFDRAYHLTAPPEARVFTIEFNPGYAAAFLETPLRDLRGRFVEPQFLWGRAALHLAEQVTEAGSNAQRARIVDDFLAARYRLRRSWPIEDTVRTIRATRGQARVADLSRSAGLSTAQFHRRFSEYVGVGPKTFLRIERLRAVVAAVRTNPNARLVEVAQQFGYFDQSHLHRDLRALTGRTPRALDLLDMRDFYKT